MSKRKLCKKNLKFSTDTWKFITIAVIMIASLQRHSLILILFHCVGGGNIDVIQSPFHALVGSSVRYSWKLSYDPSVESVVKLTFSDGSIHQSFAEGNFTHFFLTKRGLTYNTKISVDLNKNNEYSVLLNKLSFSDEKTYKLDAEFFREHDDMLLLESHPEVTFPLTIQGGPVVLERMFPSVWTLQENTDHIPSIRVQGKPKPHVEWYLGQTEKLPGSSLGLDNHIHEFSTKFKADASLCGQYLRYKVSGIQGNLSADAQIRIRFKDSPLRMRKQDYCISVEWDKKQQGNCSVKYVIDFFNKTSHKVSTSTVSSQVISLKQCYETIKEVEQVKNARMKLENEDLEKEFPSLSFILPDESISRNKVLKNKENPALNLLAISIMSGCAGAVFILFVIFLVCFFNHRKRLSKKRTATDISHPLINEAPRYTSSGVVMCEQERFLPKSKVDSFKSIQETHYMVPRPYNVGDTDTCNYETINDTITSTSDTAYTNMEQFTLVSRRS